MLDGSLDIDAVDYNVLHLPRFPDQKPERGPFDSRQTAGISMLSISNVVAMAELTRHPDSESAGAMLAQASGDDEQARWNRRQV